VDNALKFIDDGDRSKPFFLYLAFNAPHFPLMAPADEIAKFRGNYKAGWDKLREQRRARQVELGIVDKAWPLSPRAPEVKAWDALSPEEQDRFDHLMAIYAAVVAHMDAAVGRFVEGLRQRSTLDNTLILFLSDNGGNAETGPDGRYVGEQPGSVDSNIYCGQSWATLENTPFRRYKHYNHEGGISTPLIAHWPARIPGSGQLRTQPLRARAITRDLDWGVPVPLSGWQGKCLYVWFEAVVGYLSATIEWAQLNGTPAAWQDWWCDPAAESLYVIGKDNIPFHAIVWPAQLAGAADTFRVLFDGTPGSPLNLPSDIPANEFLNLEGRKISGSRNWAVWGLDVLNRYSPDALRYYLAANLPESRDTDWDWADFTTRVNGDLVGTWGNAVNRVLSLTWRHWVGRVPEPHRLGSADQELLTRIEAGFAAVGAQLDAVHLRAALAEAFGLAGDMNRYLAVQAPWAKVQPDREAAATTLWTALQGIATINTLLAPFLPHAAERLNGYLGQAGPIFGESATTAVDDALGRHTIRRYQAGEASGRWAPAAVPAGRQLRPFEHLFAKLPPDTAEVERQRRGSAQHEVRSPAAPR
jgi:hypothetical protein